LARVEENKLDSNKPSKIIIAKDSDSDESSDSEEETPLSELLASPLKRPEGQQRARASVSAEVFGKYNQR